MTYHYILLVLDVLEAHALDFTSLIIISVVEYFHDEHRFKQRIVDRLINGCYTISLAIQILILTEGNCPLWAFAEDFQDFDLFAGFWCLFALTGQYFVNFLVGNLGARLSFTVHLFVVDGTLSA